MQHYIWDESERAMPNRERSEELVWQVLKEQKIAFADAEAEAAFLAGVADETGEGRPFYVPFAFRFDTASGTSLSSASSHRSKVVVVGHKSIRTRVTAGACI